MNLEWIKRLLKEKQNIHLEFRAAASIVQCPLRLHRSRPRLIPSKIPLLLSLVPVSTAPAFYRWVQ